MIPNRLSVALGCALVGCVGALPACGGSSGTNDTVPDAGRDTGTTPPAPDARPEAAVEAAAPPSAVSAFYTDFHASNYARAEIDALALDKALIGNSTPGDMAIVDGLAHLWHLAEFGRDADPAKDSASLPAEGMNVLFEFQTAQKDNPDDPRVYCWLGVSLVDAGRQISDPMLTQQGYGVIAEGVSKYPEFNLFCQALAYAPLAVTDPDFAKAPEALFSTLDACFGETVDRSNPDITKYLSQQTDVGPKRVCWDDAITPHGAEGLYLYMGDVLVKQGNVPVAKIAYNNAKLVKGYAAWPYKSLLADRLGSDLEAKSALYKSSDSTKWPALGGDSAGVGCTYCHAATAKN